MLLRLLFQLMPSQPSALAGTSKTATEGAASVLAAAVLAGGFGFHDSVILPYLSNGP
jgi:hypothetical protein